MIFENKDRIVFAGDSVTDMGSEQPIGEGLFDSLGTGYVRVVESLLTAFIRSWIYGSPMQEQRETAAGIF